MHEMSKPIFWENKEKNKINLSFAEFIDSMVSIKQRVCSHRSFNALQSE